MFYTYVLESIKDGIHYIGCTENIEKRVTKHNKGLVEATRNRLPLKLYAYQQCKNIHEAKTWEYKYKRSRGTFNKALKNGLLVKNIFGD